MNSKASKLLAGEGPVLFDFDGPICSVFAGLQAPTVARKLRDLIASLGLKPDASLDLMSDPLEVLRWAGRSGRHDVLVTVEDALIAAESAAVETAAPTPGADALLLGLHQLGRLIGVASNNSGEAIGKYIGLHHLTAAVSAVVGRRPYSPESMKPAPDCLASAASLLGAQPRHILFVGDSVADVVAAHAIGMPVIGYAEGKGKHDILTGAGADAVVMNLEALMPGRAE